MANPKIITQPVNYGDKVSKSRNVTGMNKWAGSSRIIGFFMVILGWFTVPMEVFLRRNFGQRWFTFVNYLSGIVLIFLVAIVQLYWDSAPDTTKLYLYQHLTGLGPFNPFGHPLYCLVSDDEHRDFFTFLLYAYTFTGLYHLLKTRRLKAIGEPLHSFDDGASNLWLFAFILIGVINILALIVETMLRVFMPSEQDKQKRSAVLISDYDYFADVFLEPVVVLLVAWGVEGPARIWLFISIISLIVHTHRKQMARRHKILDFQDAKIEAQIMRELRKAQMSGTTPVKPKHTVKTAAKKQQPAPVIRYPALSVIIEEWNRQQKTAR